MINTIRFGKKVRVESAFQIKHRLLLWWLKRQAAKEADEAIVPADANVVLPARNHGEV